MKSLRIVSEYPASPILNDFEPLERIGQSQFAKAEVRYAGTQDLQKLSAKIQKIFELKTSVGYCDSNFKPKALFFDMDATVIEQESLVELAREAGEEQKIAEITERAMAGELDFKSALLERVKVLKGLEKGVLQKVGHNLIINQGMKDVIEFCSEVHVPAFLVSGGFHQLADDIGRDLGFSGVKANTLGIKDGILTGTVEGEVVDGEGKKLFVEDTCAKLGISPQDAAIVGDGANDIPMMKIGGLAIGFRPKPILNSIIHAANFTGDHRFLIPLLFGRAITSRR